LEFQCLDLACEGLDIVGNRLHRRVVTLGAGQLKQFAGATQAIIKTADAVDDLVELRAFLAQLLGAFGVVPDVGILQLAAYFFQALSLGVVVKDTP
jgi:hypothetical protein